MPPSSPSQAVFHEARQCFFGLIAHAQHWPLTLRMK
jgi:hypothetical protein